MCKSLKEFLVNNRLPQMWSRPKAAVRAQNLVLENSGQPSHQPPCCRCWPAPAWFHQTAWHRPARQPSLLPTKVRRRQQFSFLTCVLKQLLWRLTQCQNVPPLFLQLSLRSRRTTGRGDNGTRILLRGFWICWRKPSWTGASAPS